MVSTAGRKSGIPRAVWLLLVAGAIFGCVGKIGGRGPGGSPARSAASAARAAAATSAASAVVPAPAAAERWAFLPHRRGVAAERRFFPTRVSATDWPDPELRHATGKDHARPEFSNPAAGRGGDVCRGTAGRQPARLHRHDRGHDTARNRTDRHLHHQQANPRLRLFSDLGANWTEMAGSSNLPEGVWATHPDIAVGGDGTVYVTFMVSNATPNCATAPQFAPFVSQVGVAAPTGPGGSQPGTLQPAFAGGSAAVAGGMEVDLPQITASPTRPGQFVLAFVDAPFIEVVTFQRNASGTYDEVNRFPLPTQGLFPNVAKDCNGDLYVAISDPRVVRLVFTGNGWGLLTNGDGFPPVVGTYAHMSQLTFDAATGGEFPAGSTAWDDGEPDGQRE